MMDFFRGMQGRWCFGGRARWMVASTFFCLFPAGSSAHVMFTENGEFHAFSCKGSHATTLIGPLLMMSHQQ
jgi:hypothetical protein